MAFELDHLFICTTIDAPEAEQLVSFGLTEGTPIVHPGQFGFCLRSTTHPMGVLPFSTWKYSSPYLPESLNIPVATNAAVLTEPMLFYLAFGQRPDTYPTEKYQPLEHAAALREVTRAELVTPYADSLSPELKAIVNVHLTELLLGAEYLVELGFDGELQGQQIDCRPLLPLILRW